MKRLFKWILRLVLVVVVLLVLLLIFKDSILRAVIEQRIRDRSGMDVRIGRLHSGLFSPVFTLERVKVYNPPEFGGTPFLEIAELHLEIDAAELAKRNVRVTLARLNLTEIDVVRNELGQTNVYAILDKVKVRTKKSGGWKKVFGDFQFTGIETLNVTLGKARYVDLREPNKSTQVSLNMSNRVFRSFYTKLDVRANLIQLWVEIGGRFPISIDEIIQICQRWDRKSPDNSSAAPRTHPTNLASVTNAPPR